MVYYTIPEGWLIDFAKENGLTVCIVPPKRSKAGKPPKYINPKNIKLGR